MSKSPYKKNRYLVFDDASLGESEYWFKQIRGVTNKDENEYIEHVSNRGFVHIKTVTDEYPRDLRGDQGLSAD